MMLVKTYLAPSKIDGIGLFAGELIPKGTVTWRFVPGFDQVFTQAQYNSLPELAQQHLAKYSFDAHGTNGRVMVLTGDHDRYTNHAREPNCVMNSDNDQVTDTMIARVDIQEGEEITCDYSVLKQLHVTGDQNWR